MCPPKTQLPYGRMSGWASRHPRESLLSDFTSNKSPAEERPELSTAAPPLGELQAVSVCRTSALDPSSNILDLPDCKFSPSLVLSFLLFVSCRLGLSLLLL